MNVKQMWVAAVMLFALPTIAAAQDANKAVVDATLEETNKAKEELAKVEVDATKNWKCTGILSLNSSATGLWNWAAGGNNTANFIGAANVTLLYKKNKLAWASNLDTEYGMSWLENTAYPWQKSNDKLNFTTKLGYEFAPKWYATVLGSFKSQYTEGYEYSTTSKTYISNWLSPSYTDLSLGVDWKPNDIFSFYMSPFAGRLTTATDSLLRAKYNVDADKNYKMEMGLTFKGNMAYEPVENLKILSALSLFTPYTESFGNIDVDWDVAVSYQFLKVLNVKLSTSLKYYDAVLIADKNGISTQRVQFKTVLGVGVGYSF